MTALLGIAGAIALAIFGALISGEAKAEIRRWARLLITGAVAKLPPAHRTRWENEWLATLEHLTTEGRELAQLSYAARIWLRTPQITGAIFEVDSEHVDLLSLARTLRRTSRWIGILAKLESVSAWAPLFLFMGRVIYLALTPHEVTDGVPWWFWVYMGSTVGLRFAIVEVWKRLDQRRDTLMTSYLARVGLETTADGGFKKKI